MTRNIKYAIILLILILLSGCNFPTASEPTQVEVDEGAIRTSVAETLAAQISEVDEEPTVEPPAPPQDTDTPLPEPDEPTWTNPFRRLRHPHSHHHSLLLLPHR